VNQQTTKLIEDNMNLVYFTIHKYYPSFYHDEDLIQVGMVGLCKAAERFDESKNDFSTFAVSCIRNEIRMEFRKRQKYGQPLSLDYEVDVGGYEKATFGDTIVGDSDVNYLDTDHIYNSLSKAGIEVFELARRGYAYKDIATITGYHPKTVQRHLRKIKLLLQGRI
jgi:RNA polymerase sporulation-specific sigma factor